MHTHTYKLSISVPQSYAAVMRGREEEGFVFNVLQATYMGRSALKHGGMQASADEALKRVHTYVTDMGSNTQVYSFPCKMRTCCSNSMAPLAHHDIFFT